MFCVYCGNEVGERDNFCGNCGAKLNQEAPTSVGQNVSAQTATAQATPQGIRVISAEDPLFRVKCEYCRCEFEYRLGNLGYRPWYPSGFVYCPRCQRPLRHRLEYEVK